MIYPDVDDVLASVIDTFETYIAPAVDDEYAKSLSLTVAELLRSMRARVAHEGDALWADNAQLRAVLADLRPMVPAEVQTAIDAALAHRIEGYPSVPRLQQEALALRTALVASIDALPDVDHPGRQAVRTYLADELGRQQPWLVHAFVGPRR